MDEAWHTVSNFRLFHEARFHFVSQKFHSVSQKLVLFHGISVGNLVGRGRQRLGYSRTAVQSYMRYWDSQVLGSNTVKSGSVEHLKSVAVEQWDSEAMRQSMIQGGSVAVRHEGSKAVRQWSSQQADMPTIFHRSADDLDLSVTDLKKVHWVPLDSTPPSPHLLTMSWLIILTSDWLADQTGYVISCSLKHSKCSSVLPQSLPHLFNLVFT